MTDTAKSELLFNPSSYFAAPKDVIEAVSLSKEEKIKALCQWAYDIREAEVAEEEGMPDSKVNLLPEVIAALEALGHQLDMDRIGSSKQHPFMDQ